LIRGNDVEQKRMNEIIYGILVSSTQLAYVEEAYGTLALLENTNEVFRDFVSELQTVTLFNELEILERYIVIQKVRYGDRFSVNLLNESRYKSIFISHLSVIDFFDTILIELLEQNETSIEFLIEFDIGVEKINMEFIVNTDNQEFDFHKEIDYA